MSVGLMLEHRTRVSRKEGRERPDPDPKPWLTEGAEGTLQQ